MLKQYSNGLELEEANGSKDSKDQLTGLFQNCQFIDNIADLEGGAVSLLSLSDALLQLCGFVFQSILLLVIIW